MLGGLILQNHALHLEFALRLVAVWPSQREVTVCFCGCARCFCGFHTVDLKPSHLRRTGCPAHVSVARLTGNSDFYRQQGHSYISDHVHWLFTSGSFSCCFSSLIRYYLWALWWGERAISPLSAPSVPVTSPGWQQHSSFRIHLQQGKTRQNVKRSAGRHIWGEKKAGKAVSGGRNHLGAAESAGQRLRYIREQMNGA